MKFLGGIFVVALSFFVTLKILEYSDDRVVPQQTSPIPDVVYNMAALPRLSSAQALDFRGEGKNRGALLSGWSGSEPGGVWSEGHTAIIGFIADNIKPNDSAGLVILLHVDAYLVPKKLELQRVQVWFGNQKISEYAIDSSPRDLQVHLPGPLKQGAPITLGLYLPNANSPNAVVGSSDTRVVAVRLESLKLVANP
jgi:hypothetical protein